MDRRCQDEQGRNTTVTVRTKRMKRVLSKKALPESPDVAGQPPSPRAAGGPDRLSRRLARRGFPSDMHHRRSAPWPESLERRRKQKQGPGPRRSLSDIYQSKLISQSERVGHTRQRHGREIDNAEGFGVANLIKGTVRGESTPGTGEARPRRWPQSRPPPSGRDAGHWRQHLGSALV